MGERNGTVVHSCKINFRTPACTCGGVVAGENVTQQPRTTRDGGNKTILQ